MVAPRTPSSPGEESPGAGGMQAGQPGGHHWSSMLFSGPLLVCFVQVLPVSPELNCSAAARTG